MTNLKAKSLYNRITNKLDEPVVEREGDIISLYDISDIFKEEIGPFNIFFTKDNDYLGKKLNQKATTKNILFKNIPYVGRIIPSINEEGEEIISISLSENYYRIGTLELTRKGPRYNHIYNNYLNDKGFIKYCESLTKVFNDEFTALEYFKSLYPGISYKWDILRPDKLSRYEVVDGFVTGMIDLNNPEIGRVYLTSTDDYETSMKDIDGYSELQDYMGFYESEFEKRIAININDLNPLMKALYERHLNKDEKVELKLSK